MTKVQEKPEDHTVYIIYLHDLLEQHGISSPKKSDHMDAADHNKISDPDMQSHPLSNKLVSCNKSVHNLLSCPSSR